MQISQFKNFSEGLQSKAKTCPHRNNIQFINDKNQIESITFRQLHEQALSIASELSQHYPVGSRAILLYPQSLDFIFAFWGCVYAGIIPVPAPLPLRKNVTLCVQFRNIVDNCMPAVCLTDTRTSQQLNINKLNFIFENIPLINRITRKLTQQSNIDTQVSLERIPMMLTDKININHRMVKREPQDTLFIQYVPDQMSIAKRVLVTHKKALENIQATIKEFNFNECSRLMLCLPQYYGMGLMGTTLYPIYAGLTVRFMSPAQFTNDPLSWLEKIHEFRADVSGESSSAYDLCIRNYDEKRMQKIDLSAWGKAFFMDPSLDDDDDRLRQFANVFAKHGFKEEALIPFDGYTQRTVQKQASKKKVELFR